MNKLHGSTQPGFGLDDSSLGTAMDQSTNPDSSNPQSLDLSVIIVNWNTEKLTRQCIRSVYENLRDVTFEVHVVDNNSSDGSVDLIKRDFPDVSVIANSLNEGLARASNQALRKSAGRYAVLLNSDTTVIGDALNKMIGFMEAHDRVGVVGCKLRTVTGQLQPSAAWFPTFGTVIYGGSVLPGVLSRVFPLKRFPGQTYLNARDHDRLQEVDWVVGACMMVRVSALGTTGLLDENLFMYYEEIDWCYRIKKAGWSVVYLPEAEICHLGGGSSSDVGKESTYRSAFAQRYYYHKHHGRVQAAIYDCVRLLMSLGKMAIWAMISMAPTRRRSARMHLSYHQAVWRLQVNAKHREMSQPSLPR